MIYPPANVQINVVNHDVLKKQTNRKIQETCTLNNGIVPKRRIEECLGSKSLGEQVSKPDNLGKHFDVTFKQQIGLGYA